MGLLLRAVAGAMLYLAFFVDWTKVNGIATSIDNRIPAKRESTCNSPNFLIEVFKRGSQDEIVMVSKNLNYLGTGML